VFWFLRKRALIHIFDHPALQKVDASGALGTECKRTQAF